MKAKKLWAALMALVMAISLLPAAALAADTITIEGKSGTYATIGEAIEAAAAGDTIVLGEGEYELPTTGANKDCQILKPVSFKGAGAEKTTLVGSINMEFCSMCANTLKSLTISDLTMQGAGVHYALNFPGGNASCQTAHSSRELSDFTFNITNCQFKDYQYTVGVNGFAKTSTLKITGSEFINTGCAAAIQTGAGNDVEFSNVKVDSGYAVQAFGGTGAQANGFYKTYEGYKTNPETPDLDAAKSPILFVTSQDDLAATVAKAAAGATIMLTGGEYDIGSLQVPGAINIQGAGADKTILNGSITYKGTPSAEDKTIVVSGISLNATADNNHQGLNWANWGTYDGYELNVENCAFNGWEYAIGVNSGAEKCQLNVSGTAFNNTWCAMSFSAGAGNTLGTISDVTTTEGAFAVQSFDLAADSQNPHNGYYYTVGSYEKDAADGAINSPDKDATKETVAGMVVTNSVQLEAAVAKAKEGATIILAPSTYDGNIFFGGKSLTIKAQNYAYENGVLETDDNKLTKFTGTFNTHNTGNAFKADQKIVIEGIAFSGDGLKVGNNNYNGVGTLEVRNCTMTCGNNLASGDRFNRDNYFVKTSGDDGQTNSGYASVIVEDNYITGTDPKVTPLQLWRVDNVIVKNNVFDLGGKVSAVSVSKMAKDAQVSIIENDIRNAESGISVTNWLMNGGQKEGNSWKDDPAVTFQGSISVLKNAMTNVGNVNEKNSPIFIGAENENQASLGGNVSVNGNTNNGIPVGADVDAGNQATVQFYSVVVKNEDVIVESANVNGNEFFTLPAAPTKQGYEFKGWKSSVNNQVYDANVMVSISADTIFTAVYEIIVAPVPGHAISVVTDGNGTVTTTPVRAEAGETVTINVTPNAGYEVADITVTTVTGEAVSVSGNRFTMPNASVTVKVTFVKTAASNPFTDVNTGNWFYDEVMWAYENGVMDGIGGGKFGPNNSVSRAMVWTVLARLDNKTISGSDWADEARAWAMAEGITDGTMTNGSVTREQLATMLYRYAKSQGLDVSIGEDTNILSYSDANQVSDWAVEAMQWACGTGIIGGMDGKLNPQGGATRAQMVTMLMRFVEDVA